MCATTSGAFEHLTNRKYGPKAFQRCSQNMYTIKSYECEFSSSSAKFSKNQILIEKIKISGIFEKIVKL